MFFFSSFCYAHTASSILHRICHEWPVQNVVSLCRCTHTLLSLCIIHTRRHRRMSISFLLQCLLPYAARPLNAFIISFHSFRARSSTIQNRYVLLSNMFQKLKYWDRFLYNICERACLIDGPFHWDNGYNLILIYFFSHRLTRFYAE